MSAGGHALVFAALACAAAPAGHALEDPTRPPMGQRQVSVRRPVSELVLQSVIISDKGRAALINGELVQLGARLGEARLVRVGEAEVELLVGDERRTLALFPGVAKTASGMAHPRLSEAGGENAGAGDPGRDPRGPGGQSKHGAER